MSTNSETTSNSVRPANEIPVLSRPEERVAAAERTRAYPYRFPRDGRQLGGKFSVEENARRLLRFFYFEPKDRKTHFGGRSRLVRNRNTLI